MNISIEQYNKLKQMAKNYDLPELDKIIKQLKKQKNESNKCAEDCANSNGAPFPQKKINIEDIPVGPNASTYASLFK